MRKRETIKDLCLFSDEELDAIIDTGYVEEAKTNNETLNNSNIIKNISFDNTEILHNIGILYNNGSDLFDCDITASCLGFYGKGKGKYNIPEPKILMDVCPTREDIIQIDKWGKLPLDNESIHSLVIDLPFVVSPAGAPSKIEKKEGASLIAQRFSAYYPVDNLYLSYYHWLSEAARVLDVGGCAYLSYSLSFRAASDITVKSFRSWQGRGSA